MSIFKNKVFVITGAGSGIGRCLAEQLACKGAQLALSDINAEALNETIELLPSSTQAKAYTFDVANREAMFSHADQVVADFGAVHGVFNNAGVTVVGTFEHLSSYEIEWQLRIYL
ncbi:MAG: SDR family NAD(P)-dependent oxidoreductase, partial [Oceanococcus sp.]